MNLNSIELPALVIADLYKNSLVEPAGDQKIIPENAPNQLKYLGSNKKNVLFCVRYESVPHLPDEQLTFLITMLAACKLSLGDVAILNLYHFPGYSYKEILADLKSQTVFLSGITPAEFGLPINFPQFQLQSFNNSAFLYTPTLEDLDADKILKSKLWVCLRRIFSL